MGEACQGMSSVVSEDVLMSTVTLTLLAQVPLHQLQVMQVGSNAPYLNHGLFRHELETSVVPKIRETITNLSSASPKESLQLAVAGFLLPLLEKYEPEALASLQSFVKEKHVTLLAVPYYNTSLRVLSSQELTKQLKQEQEALATYFGKEAEGFFSADGFVPKSSPFTTIFVGKQVVGSVALSTLTNRVIATPTITLGHDVVVKTSFSEMESHLFDEYTALTPHVFATKDDELCNQWQLLGQSGMFTTACTSLYPDESYDHYATYMNILNDVAHKIKTVELGKQGLFATEPMIVPSPAKILESLR